MMWSPAWDAAAKRVADEREKMRVREAMFQLVSIIIDHLRGKELSGLLEFDALPSFEYVDLLRPMFDHSGKANMELLHLVSKTLPAGIWLVDITSADKHSPRGSAETFVHYTVVYRFEAPGPAT